MFKRFLLWFLFTVIFILLLRLLPFTFNLLSSLARTIASQERWYQLLHWPLTAETYGDMEALALLTLCAIPAAIIAMLCITFGRKAKN
ncbi:MULTISPECIES: hypothetical protein [Serratia]|uniref:Uncharacterized protein n=1 Tax=Serratia rhizosphaerae TaxID=2597702 RepID=A0ABX6GIT7_9GAMM|nr:MULTISPECIES: hypothetical protein [Serratia]MBU3894083.1 hypothetical protein [Serratia rubidaea]MEB6335836.1 hypothetical protein [Serratia rhizosphaerae]QHA86172.1 hypothetical protein FO014_03815 [Serratia rhizosphaerae]QPT14718.1 hypothetical protein I6G37_07080 [Serratia rubidaea]CAE1143648.1 conserved protein of unknown function [Serratia sp. Tan611]